MWIIFPTQNVLNRANFSAVSVSQTLTSQYRHICLCCSPGAHAQLGEMSGSPEVTAHPILKHKHRSVQMNCSPSLCLDYAGRFRCLVQRLVSHSASVFWDCCQHSCPWGTGPRASLNPAHSPEPSFSPPQVRKAIRPSPVVESRSWDTVGSTTNLPGVTSLTLSLWLPGQLGKKQLHDCASEGWCGCSGGGMATWIPQKTCEDTTWSKNLSPLLYSGLLCLLPQHPTFLLSCGKKKSKRDFLHIFNSTVDLNTLHSLPDLCLYCSITLWRVWRSYKNIVIFYISYQYHIVLVWA